MYSTTSTSSVSSQPLPRAPLIKIEIRASGGTKTYTSNGAKGNSLLLEFKKQWPSIIARDTLALMLLCDAELITQFDVQDVRLFTISSTPLAINTANKTIEIRTVNLDAQLAFSTTRGLNMTVALLRRVGVLIDERDEIQSLAAAINGAPPFPRNMSQIRLSQIPTSYNLVSYPPSISEAPLDMPQSASQVQFFQSQSPAASSDMGLRWPGIGSPRPPLLRTESMPIQSCNAVTNPYHVFLGTSYYSNFPPPIGSPLGNPPEHHVSNLRALSSHTTNPAIVHSPFPTFVTPSQSGMPMASAKSNIDPQDSTWEVPKEMDDGLSVTLPKRRNLPFNDGIGLGRKRHVAHNNERLNTTKDLAKTLPDSHPKPIRKRLNQTHVGKPVKELPKPKSAKPMRPKDARKQDDLVSPCFSRIKRSARSRGRTVGTDTSVSSVTAPQPREEIRATPVVRSQDDTDGLTGHDNHHREESPDILALLNLFKNDENLSKLLKKHDSCILDQYSIDRAKGKDCPNLAIFYVRRLQQMRSTILCQYITVNSSAKVR